MSLPNLRFPEFKEKWNITELGKVVEFKKGSLISKNDLSSNGKPCILYGELYTKYGPVIRNVVSRTNRELTNPVIGQKNDVLIPSSGESAIDIACASAIDTEENVILGGDLNVLTPNNGVNGKFISYQINGVRKEKLSTFAQGASVVHLYNNSLKNFEITLPETEEQQKIADFFSLLDSRIEKQQEKVEALQEQKKGLLQKIFSQELRFKDDNGKDFDDWNLKKLKEIVSLKLRPVPKPSDSYIRLGLRSHAKGTFHTLVDKPEDVSMDTLYLVKESDLIVNITFAWEHAIAVANKNDENKLVSHRFPTYIFNQNEVPEFYNHRLMMKDIKYLLGNASPGGAGRNRVLNKNDFLNISFKVPSFEEQRKIAEFLSTFDQKIENETIKLSTIQEQKKGFLQQMFI